jgi:Thioesterase domain/Phosphopantetheine attachment site
LGFHPIGIHDDFFALGGHSLLAARLFVLIEKIFGEKPPISILYQRPTVAQLAEIFRDPALLTSETSSFLVPINPSGNKPPFFFIQGLTAIPTLRRHIGEDQPLYFLYGPFELLHGPFEMKDKRILYSRVKEMASSYLKEIQNIQPNGPYFLGGYSAGGLLAFEIAQQIQKQGHEAAFLFLLDPTSPNKSRLSNMPISYHIKHFSKLRPVEWKPFLWENFRMLGGRLKTKLRHSIINSFRQINRFLPAHLLNRYVYEALVLAMEDYVPQPLSTKTLLMGTDERLHRKDLFDMSTVLPNRTLILNINESHAQIAKKSKVHLWMENLIESLQNAQKEASPDIEGKRYGAKISAQ